MKITTNYKSIVGIATIFTSITATSNNLYPPHSGNSPFDFTIIGDPSAEYQISDKSSGNLDRYQPSDSRDYQISVSLPIKRYVGDVAAAVSNGTLSKEATIIIPAYDVDSSTTPVFDCDNDDIDDTLFEEVNEVYFNGELIGTLKGENNIWKFNDRLTVPIEKVNFPSAPGTAANNTVEIAIDVKNKNTVLSSGAVGCPVWATSVDWVGIKFDAADPAYLMTGFGGNPYALEQSGYADNIENNIGISAKVIDHGIASLSSSCSPGSLNAISDNANSFIDIIIADAGQQGASEVHLIGHSMSGLDGRMIINKAATNDIPVQVTTMDGSPVYQNLKVKSLMTHGAPHKGTLLADIAGVLTSAITDLCDLKTETWAMANSQLLPFGTKIAAIGSDADGNNDQQISAAEATGLQNTLGLNPNNLYYMLYYYDKGEWTITYNNIGGILIPVPDFKLSGGASHNPNDIMVTVNSALGATGSISSTILNSTNHGTIINTNAQNTAINIGKSTLGWGDK
ncbi:hypothetical protein [Dasania marina]|uniref:hypothetical protein n=1 Tax=Dasania marina TaxID=471499 RepID=UPI00036C6DA2|nr:hypothetical protein [Dasania marina]